MGELILTSKGLNTRVGRHLYKTALSQMGYSDLSRLTIGLISHPCYEIEEILIAACVELGFAEKNVFILTGKEKIYRKYDMVYVVSLVNEKKNYQCIFIALILSLIIMLLCFILNDFSHFDTGNALFITSILLLFPNRSITRRKTLKKLLAELEERA